MQDFSPDDCRYRHGPESLHPVYKMAMSARDLARVGLLYLRGGRWNGVQVVPEDWVRLSTQPHSDVGGGRGYGYLWMTAEAYAQKDPLSIETPLFYASGLAGNTSSSLLLSISSSFTAPPASTTASVMAAWES